MKMKNRMKKLLAVLLLAAMALGTTCAALGETTEAEAKPYQLEQVVVLSRHNIRAPLSNSGSAVAELTPHTWTEWTARDSELTMKGGVSETMMGQYFRKWLEAEALIPENYIPEGDEVRFYANARQRTIATAQYFAAGMLPIGNVNIEYKGKIGDNDPVFKTILTYVSDAYSEAARAQVDEIYGLWRGSDFTQALNEDMALLADVIDYKDSHGYQSGEYTDWTMDDIGVDLVQDKETVINGSLKTAMAASDALLLQYYEMDDANAAAFGRDLTDEEWEKIAAVTGAYQQIRHISPLIGINLAHYMLIELRDELQTPGRKFSFLCGHDSNVGSVLASLGVVDFELPGTIEKHTPIGCKLVFEKWVAQDGEEYARVRMVYPGTEQLRKGTPLTLANPPMDFDIELPGVERNADGYYRLEDVVGCLQSAIDAFDALPETYGAPLEMDAAA